MNTIIVMNSYYESHGKLPFYIAEGVFKAWSPDIVVMVVSTVANMFLTLFQAVLIHVNTLITTSQA